MEPIIRHKTCCRLTFWTIVLFFVLTAPLRADIYKYVDENGVMHFTNVPTSARYQLFMSGKTGLGAYYTTSKYDNYIALASRMYNVSFSLVKAVIKVESNFNARAVSKKGAQGLMQIMPGTAKILKVHDPFDPWENIMGGTKYLRMMLDQFDGSLNLALAGYNAGPTRVARYNAIPPIKETQNYVEKVLQYYRHMKSKEKPRQVTASSK